MSIGETFRESRLITRYIDNYEFRPQQIQMAEAVERAISSGRDLLVEAGTGVGKSIAYLIPFIKWLRRSNKRVVISTYTKTLQEQLINKDLPSLQGIFGFNFRFTLCVGGQNYLCLRRLNQLFNYDLFDGDREIREISEISKWQKETDTGLRSDLDFEPEEVVWAKVCRESDLCLGRDCFYRKDCFYNKARLKAFKSHILVINHHLYFANLISGGRVLPCFDAVVFDEAHTLEDVATNYLGIEVSNFRIKNLIDSVLSLQKKKGYLARLRHLNQRHATEIEKRIDEVRIASQSFFSQLVSKFGQDSKVQRIRDKNSIYNHLKEPLLRLGSSLAEILDDLNREEEKIEAKSFVLRTKQVNSELEDIINQNRKDYVYWVEILNRPKRSKYSLCAAPIDISGEFKDKILNKDKLIIFTSATLSTNGNFEFIKRNLGIADCNELILDSPFNYTENVRLYIPKSISDPSIEFDSYQKDVIEELKKILLIMKGRTFALFTNYKMMDTVYDILKKEFGGSLNILRQGDLPRYRLLQKFKEKPNSILLGTDTFWQGVDVPGKALECVIITKLPFAVPDEPITEAKIEFLQSRNIDSFVHYQIPQAIIMFRQGFGRLIRTKNDIGIVAVLDPRIETRFYGRSFLDSLPKCRKVNDLTEIQSFFLERKFQGSKKTEGYLDIETDHLSPLEGEITVVGIGKEQGEDFSFLQLIEKGITAKNLVDCIKDIDIIYTYNGTDFDLPFIKQKLKIDIDTYCKHRDLKFGCWRNKLYGGLKEVESKPKIEKKIKDIDGKVATDLWKRYKKFNDREALSLLLEYNKEDVFNLKSLKEALYRMCDTHSKKQI